LRVLGLGPPSDQLTPISRALLASVATRQIATRKKVLQTGQLLRFDVIACRA